MEAIKPLWSQMPLSAGQTAAAEKTGKDPFTDIFHEAINSVKETDAEKTQMEYLMATGQLDNPALLTIASTKAQLSVELLIQLRSKSMEAYNELLRMNV